MNRDVVRMWVEALRSEKYRQGRAALELVHVGQDPEHCCLGVLIRELDKQQWREAGCPVIEKQAQPYIRHFTEFRVPGETNWTYGHLPAGLAKWLGTSEGVEMAIPGRDSDMRELTAVDLNDDMKLTFPQIADVLEWYFLSGE